MLGVVVVGALVAAPISQVFAAAPEIRFARQFSMGYLQFNIMEHEKLLEKHRGRWGYRTSKYPGLPSMARTR